MNPLYDYFCNCPNDEILNERRWKMALATKEQALEELRERKEKNKDRVRIKNSDLYAGSDMYYYCVICGEEMRLPETHTCAAPTHCNECKALIENGWL